MIANSTMDNRVLNWRASASRYNALLQRCVGEDQRQWLMNSPNPYQMRTYPTVTNSRHTRRLLPTAYCLLLTAYCLLLTAYCLLPTAVSGIRAFRTVSAELLQSRIGA